MIMMQQAFNDILLNVTQANDYSETKSSSSSSSSKPSLSFFDSNPLLDSHHKANNNISSTLTSSILKNNFFSNLVANDYLLDNKENYNLNDGSASSSISSSSSSSSPPLLSNIDKNIIKSSPLSSGLSSLSSSLTLSSSPTSLLNESLSRSSSTCSLLSSTIKQQQHHQQHEQEQQENQQQEPFRLVNKSSSSSPGLMNDLFMGTSMAPPLSSSVSASNNSSMESPFSFNVGPIGCSSNISPCLLSKTASGEVSSFLFGTASALSANGLLNLNNSKKSTKYDLTMQANSSGDFMSMNGGENSIDWSLLSDTSRHMLSSTHQAAKDETLQWLLKMNKEFYWNIKKLTEMAIMGNYNKMNVSTESSFTNSALPTNCLSSASSNCNINVNNNANYGMNSNMNKMSRKLGGNHSLQMPISNGQRQTVSPNMQPHPAVVNKFFSMNQQQPQQQQQQQPNNLMYHPIQQQQQKLNNNLSYQQSNYNQQFTSNNTNSRIFGRIITNNRGYPQRVQC